MANEKKQPELETFKKWKATNDPKYFQELYGSMKPLIYDAARKASYGSNLPESAHRAYAAQSFHDALKTYNPTGGAALQSHVYGAVHQKAKRLNYMYQNLSYMPEPRAMNVGVYQNAVANLRDALSREPSPQEVATNLGWSIKEVERIKKEVHKDLALDAGTEEFGVYETPETEEVLEYIYFSLTPEEQLAYDHIFGKHGKPKMTKANGRIDYERIGRVLGFSPSKVRGIVTRIKVKYEKAAKK